MITACVFPGQGSQHSGMAADFVQHSLTAPLFEQADDILGFHLTGLMLNGDEETLKRTENAQPALLLAGVAAFTYCQNTAVETQPTYLAGHSVGEYTAACVAGCLSFSEALKLVRLRGEVMAQAPEGGMAAVLGAEDDKIKEICHQNTLYVANDNAPGQVVVAGQKDALAAAWDDLAGAAKKVVALQVSGSFHTPYMQAAADAVEAALSDINIQVPDVPLILNADASEARTLAAVQAGLVRQITQTVRWREVMAFMRAQGVEKIYECGAGKVLTGLARRCDKAFICEAITNTNL